MYVWAEQTVVCGTAAGTLHTLHHTHTQTHKQSQTQAERERESKREAAAAAAAAAGGGGGRGGGGAVKLIGIQHFGSRVDSICISPLVHNVWAAADSKW